ncbi:tetratricopeptide repeat protein [Paenimyroides aestuarii]|uniref:Tetratricopeptide repeat protein n=1 Tax=Paenimyroides aestuarii TaxID=2968490 RepID=A0ABY5NW48_9FLAO|nr:tetratricopeptide repeat protein [Paenimyroides aestuarii]UUV22587.1 tetratricopeptide repeat protein [Paenimyroides aestuarii]
MRCIFMLFTSILFSSISLGQNKYDKFKLLFNQNDTIELQKLLIDWRKSNANDPELYTSEFNYYFSVSKNEFVSLQQNIVDENSYEIIDSLGNVAGYLTSNVSYNKEKLDKAFVAIDEGIRKFPNRLDMRFGKIYAYGKIEDYANFTKTIVETVEYSVINNNEWLWTEDLKNEDGERVLLETVQSYLVQLYDTENDNLLPNMITIGETTLKYYPKNVEILSTTAIAFLLMKNYDKAIYNLKNAEQISPQDYIVLNNIAQAYKMKGEKLNAIKYYELVAKYGDEETKYQALENIEQLKVQ